MIVEGTLKELRGASGGTQLRAEQVDRAREIIAARWGADAVRVAAKADAADINHVLVSAGIRVSELRPIDRSLEDVFLELTGPPSGPPTGPPTGPPSGPPSGPPR